MAKKMRKTDFYLKKIQRKKQQPLTRMPSKERPTLMQIIQKAPMNRYVLRDYLSRYWFSKNLDNQHFAEINKLVDFSFEEWDIFLGINLSDIADVKDLPDIYFERIMDIFILMNKGADTFGSYDDFKTWLNEPNTSFQNLEPIHYFESSTGVNYLMDTLTQLDYGVIV